LPERELIEYIRNLCRDGELPWLSVPMGDDAAEVEVPAGGRFLVTTDMLIEAVHFEPDTPARVVGRKAVARAHSDTAAMAARPLCTLAAVSFPAGWAESECQELCRSLHGMADELLAPLIGGDISSTDGPLSITVTALGTPGPAGAITRSGARPEDAICVTGRLGGSSLGRHLTFRPRIEEALALAAVVDLHAMIDISDGLSTDALHVARASGVSVELDADAIPLSDEAHSLAERTGRSPLWHALNDGEDYELLFCLARPQADGLVESGIEGVPVSIIGRVSESDHSELVMPDGRRRTLLAGGWEHLKE
jgi:thiamine-monophosphate kinase